MEMMTITPVRPWGGNVRIFLDSEEVTNRAYSAHVPTEPGVEADGEVGMWILPLVAQADGKPKREVKAGRVYWVRKAEAES